MVPFFMAVAGARTNALQQKGCKFVITFTHFAALFRCKIRCCIIFI